MDLAIKRPALRGYGSKWKKAPWIISFFPAHTNYLEVCGLTASVLLQKVISPLETFNDIDERVVSFFEVLRNRPNELIDLIRLTPWARVEFEEAQQVTGDPLEDARRFWVLCWQSVSKPGGSWRKMRDFSARPRSTAMDGVEISHLYEVAERFKRVQLECMDALEIIPLYDHPETLVYFDPPYVGETRVNSKYYDHEVDSDFHKQAAELLRMAKGYVVASGYACELYQEIYEAYGWTRFDTKGATNGGSGATESVWLSPRTVKAVRLM